MIDACTMASNNGTATPPQPTMCHTNPAALSVHTRTACSNSPALCVIPAMSQHASQPKQQSLRVCAGAHLQPMPMVKGYNQALCQSQLQAVQQNATTAIKAVTSALQVLHWNRLAKEHPRANYITLPSKHRYANMQSRQVSHTQALQHAGCLQAAAKTTHILSALNTKSVCWPSTPVKACQPSPGTIHSETPGEPNGC